MINWGKRLSNQYLLYILIINLSRRSFLNKNDYFVLDIFIQFYYNYFPNGTNSLNVGTVMNSTERVLAVFLLIIITIQFSHSIILWLYKYNIN